MHLYYYGRCPLTSTKILCTLLNLGSMAANRLLLLCKTVVPSDTPNEKIITSSLFLSGQFSMAFVTVLFLKLALPCVCKNCRLHSLHKSSYAPPVRHLWLFAEEEYGLWHAISSGCNFTVACSLLCGLTHLPPPSLSASIHWCISVTCAWDIPYLFSSFSPARWQSESDQGATNMKIVKSVLWQLY